jgi:hypothetical protein
MKQALAPSNLIKIFLLLMNGFTVFAISAYVIISDIYAVIKAVLISALIIIGYYLQITGYDLYGSKRYKKAYPSGFFFGVFLISFAFLIASYYLVLFTEFRDHLLMLVVFTAYVWLLYPYRQILFSKEKLKEHLELTRKIYFGNGIKQLGFSILMIIFISTAYVFLSSTLPPFFDLGWTSLFFDDASTSNVIGIGITFFTGSAYKFLLIPLAIVIITLLGDLAYQEEILFRKGKTKFISIFQASTTFGAIHLLVGVSLKIAFLLSLVGFIYAFFYNLQLRSLKKRYPLRFANMALFRTAGLHATTNSILFLMMITITLFS